MKAALIAISILTALAAANASAAITTITCKNRHSFNYGFLELSKTDTEITIVMSATNLQGVGRALTGPNSDPTRQLKFTLPPTDCVLLETGSRLPLRCDISNAPVNLEITGYSGNVQQVPVDYASLETVVRLEESVSRPTPQRLAVAQLHIVKGSRLTAQVFKQDVYFDFNECSRTDAP